MPHRRIWTGIVVCLACCVARLLAAADTGTGSAFQLSFVPGSRDAGGHFMGGSELRILTAHAGKLFAGNGYWEDRPGSEGVQGAQILVLDAPNAQWRVDHTFDDRQPNGRPHDLAVSALSEVRFATDATARDCRHRYRCCSPRPGSSTGPRGCSAAMTPAVTGLRHHSRRIVRRRTSCRRSAASVRIATVSRASITCSPGRIRAVSTVVATTRR